MGSKILGAELPRTAISAISAVQTKQNKLDRGGVILSKNNIIMKKWLSVGFENYKFSKYKEQLRYTL